MKNVLIVGYPKSGTTWLTLLVSDLLQAPVKGYWGSEHQELARSNLSRQSEYVCYKSHASYSELKSHSEIDKIVYIVRDPRSVCDSIKHYFYPPKIQSKSYPAKLINKLFWFIEGRSKMEAEATKAILQGNEDLNGNLKLSWKKHYLPFKNDESTYFMKYEDLLTDGKAELGKLSTFLNVDFHESDIAQLLDAHSFNKMKKRFKTENNREGIYLMRSGKLNSWRKNLNPVTISKLNSELKEDFGALNYSL